MQAHRKARPAAMTIEGEAVVLERHPGAAQVTPHRPPEEPINDNHPGAAFPATRPQPKPDLVFPGRVRWPSRVGHAAERRASRIGRAAAAGTILAALAAVALVLASRPGAPVAAEPRFELTETAGSLSVHRDGPVLAVEGRIRNVSTRAGMPPEVAVRLNNGAEGALSRSFRPGTAVLQPGASLFFHSTLAVPSATSGTIAVSLARAAEGKSMPR